MDVEVVVIGSLNRDISVITPHLPRPGESVTGTDHFFGPGGKGANQAVAVARLGARVAMVGRVGDDEHGASLVSGLEDDGVGVAAVGVDAHAATGLAVITIDEHAENTIVVSPGANSTLSAKHIEEQSDLIARARVVLAQLEVPLDAVTAAAQIADGIFCLNPAPARSLPPDLLDRIDILVPNRSELGGLTRSTEPETTEKAIAMAHSLPHTGSTVVTLGAEGVVIVEDGETTTLPAPRVEPVDPTGAGDAFCGALAYSLSRGRPLVEATRLAVVAGAVAVTRRGAQPAMPTLDEVEALLDG